MLHSQIISLFILAIPVACISWTFTHEEIFKEVHNYCVKRSLNDKLLYRRKFFYMLNCEYCFSHYITIAILFLTGYKLLFTGWVGYLVSGFSLVWIANIYMGLYNMIRINLKKEKLETEIEEHQLKEQTKK